MVEFCKSCGVSLPDAEILIINGRIIVSPDYICPECKKPANPGVKMAPTEPAEGKDLIIRDGKVIES
jgi:hypothetical protein